MCFLCTQVHNCLYLVTSIYCIKQKINPCRSEALTQRMGLQNLLQILNQFTHPIVFRNRFRFNPLPIQTTQSNILRAGQSGHFPACQEMQQQIREYISAAFSSLVTKFKREANDCCENKKYVVLLAYRPKVSTTWPIKKKHKIFHTAFLFGLDLEVAAHFDAFIFFRAIHGVTALLYAIL